MKCQRVSQLLTGYIDRELDGLQIEEIKEHLDICAKCRAEFEVLSKTVNLVNYAFQQETERIPEEVCFSILEKVRSRT